MSSNTNGVFFFVEDNCDETLGCLFFSPSFMVIKCCEGDFGADLLEWFGESFESRSLSGFEVGDGVEESESDPDFEE